MNIILNDLLGFTKEELESSRIKVRFNLNNGCENPIDVYKRNPAEINERWLLWRKKRRCFGVGDIAICLVLLGADRWLLTGIKRITKELDVSDGVNYEAEDIERFKGIAQGRVVVSFHKKHQVSDRNYSDICKELIVSEVLASSYDGDGFPGYDRVHLSYEELKAIVSRGKSDWINALRSQKAVYLISDSSSGKMYVGSATASRGMLLERWTAYVHNGHGGNIELKKVIEDRGLEYARKNFFYSILENYNARVSDELIMEREGWWKEMLMTRKFGYNLN